MCQCLQIQYRGALLLSKCRRELGSFGCGVHWCAELGLKLLNELGSDLCGRSVEVLMDRGIRAKGNHGSLACVFL